MKKRSQIEEKYKWRLEDIYASEDELLRDIETLKSYEDKFKSYRGKLKKPNKCLEFFLLQTECSKLSDKIYSYVGLRQTEDLENAKYIELSSVLSSISKKLSVATSFEETELLNCGEKYINKLLKDDRFVDYYMSLKDFLRNIDHILPENEEVLVTKSLVALGTASDVYDNIDTLDLKFDDVTNSKGKKFEVNQHNYSQLLESKDRTLRKNAMLSMQKGYHSWSNTISTNYIGSVEGDWFLADAYKFQSCLEKSMFGENIPESVYFSLIDNVRKNLKLVHKFYALKKKALKLPDFYTYDRYVSITNYSDTIDYETSFDKVVEAMSVLGDEYVTYLNMARNNRWIDVYPCEKKESGGFCWGMYEPHPYILLNTVEDSRGIYTLAHELGHAMHGVLSAKNQPYELHGHTIFLAEIASTVNEVLLFKYLYKNAKTDKERLSHLERYIGNIIATIYVQTMYSEFEHYAHDLVEKGLPVSKDLLNNRYKQLNMEYYGKGVKMCPGEIGEGWMRIPHFYRPYYVYKYSTGMTSAINFAINILNGKENALEKYLEFLKSGTSDYSIEILKKAGVDLTTSAPYEVAFNELSWALKEMENLIK